MGGQRNLLNPDLLGYKIPTVHEMPEVVPIIVESNDPEGPFGAKEAGKGPYYRFSRQYAMLCTMPLESEYKSCP